jgi:hypothetical protein
MPPARPQHPGIATVCVQSPPYLTPTGVGCLPRHAGHQACPGHGGAGRARCRPVRRQCPAPRRSAVSTLHPLPPDGVPSGHRGGRERAQYNSSTCHIRCSQGPTGPCEPDVMTCREPQRPDDQSAKQLVQVCLPEVEVCLHDDGSEPMMYDLDLRWPDGRIEALEVTWPQTTQNSRSLGDPGHANEHLWSVARPLPGRRCSPFRLTWAHQPVGHGWPYRVLTGTAVAVVPVARRLDRRLLPDRLRYAPAAGHVGTEPIRTQPSAASPGEPVGRPAVASGQVRVWRAGSPRGCAAAVVRAGIRP